MFDPLADAPHVWIGVSLVSLAVLGVAVDVPRAPPPDAGAVADTVDAVAARDHPTRATHPLTATSVRIAPHRLALRGGGATAHATFRYGPVAPVAEGSALARVLRGVPPERAFDSRRTFARALSRAENRSADGWERADDRLVVRRVFWGDVDATLVGA